MRARCHGNQILLVLVHGRRCMEAASGAAGRANAGLCSASSLCLVTRRTSLGCRSIDVGATRTVDVRRRAVRFIVFRSVVALNRLHVNESADRCRVSAFEV